MWKFKNRFFRYYKIVGRDFVSPLFDKNQFLQLLTIPIMLLLSLISGEVTQEVQELSKTAIAIIFTIPLWLLWNILSGLFKVCKEEKKEGYWQGNRFIYHEPYHLKTLVNRHSKNEQRIRFKLSDAPPNSFVQFQIVNDGGYGTIQLSQHENNSFDWGTGQQRYGVRLNKKSEIVAVLKCPSDSDETISRISMLYWEK